MQPTEKEIRFGWYELADGEHDGKGNDGALNRWMRINRAVANQNCEADFRGQVG
jgi:hypothetical protein